MMSEPQYASGILRALVYAGTILSAGAILFASTFPQVAQSIRLMLRRQLMLGSILVLLVEPLRYVMFQLSIAGGDATVAFSGDMMWMGIELPGGQASLFRIAGVVLIAIAGLRAAGAGHLSTLLGLAGTALAIGSYALEGHTAASAQPFWMGLVLILHLVAIHWWIGGLWPLAETARISKGPALEQTIERFGAIATAVVALVVVTGAITLMQIVSWRFDPTNSYQQVFAAKIAGVSAVLALAALNKLRLTPLLRSDPELAVRRLRWSIRLEFAVALIVLTLTGFITLTSPGPEH